MDSLLEAAKTYIEVLQNCRSDRVASWKIEDLERAVNWAEYFKRVQGRIQKKSSLVTKFDAQLKEMGSQIGRFGQQELSSEFLGGSLHYLLTTLLENPSLPADVKLSVQNKYATSEHLKHMGKVVQNQTLLSTLTAVHRKLTVDLPPHASPFLRGDPLLIADALALQDEVEWMLLQQPNTTASSLPSQKQQIHSKLEELATLEHGMEEILYSTVTRFHLTRTHSAEDTTTNAPTVILEWLEHRLLGTPQTPPTNDTTKSQQMVHSDTQRINKAGSCITAERFWALPPHFLAGISVQSIDCFRLIIKLLISRVNQLQTEVMREFENNRDTHSDAVFSERLENEVLPYFRALLTIDDRVREVTAALVASQVEETAAKVLAVGSKDAPILASSSTSRPRVSNSHPSHYPINLWRKILAIRN